MQEMNQIRKGWGGRASSICAAFIWVLLVIALHLEIGVMNVAFLDAVVKIIAQ